MHPDCSQWQWHRYLSAFGRIDVPKSNLPYLSQQMLKIIFAMERTVLHSFLIQNISTYSELSQYARCSLAELGCPDAVHTITYANNSIEVVEHSFSFNLPITFHSNYFHFGNSSLFCEFSLLKMFLRCLLIAGMFTSKSIPVAFCVHHTVLSL